MKRTIDFIYNVDTFGPALDYEHAGRWAHAYDTGPWSAPLKMLKRLRLDFARSSFIDMGSGKGRVVLAASTLPFVTVIGVEFSPALCRIARQNIANCRILHRRAKQTSILEIDAAQFAAPNTPCIFYFYNPFHRDLMKTVISNIVNSYHYNPSGNIHDLCWDVDDYRRYHRDRRFKAPALVGNADGPIRKAQRLYFCGDRWLIFNRCTPGDGVQVKVPRSRWAIRASNQSARSMTWQPSRNRPSVPSLRDLARPPDGRDRG